MTVRGGSSGYAIAMCSSLGASDVPAGDIVYFNAPNVKPKWTFESKIYHEIGRQSYCTRDNKKKWVVTVPKCLLKSDVETTTMEELNQVTKYIEDWTESNHDPVYLFIANRSLDGTYTEMKFRDNTLTQSDQKYLKGYPTSFSPELEAAVNYVICTFTFEECWL